MDTNITYAQVRRAVEGRGFKFFDAGPYDLNLVAIRNDNRDFETDAFDDLLVCAYLDHDRKPRADVWPCTTDPGLCMITHPTFAEAIANCAAFIAPGQYRGAYVRGWHGAGAWRHEALVQVRRMNYHRVKSATGHVSELDHLPTQWGVFGTNIHRALAAGLARNVGNFSAGCVVLQDAVHLSALLALVTLQTTRGYGASVTLSLILQRFFYIK